MAHKAAQRSSATGAAQRPALVKAALVASRAAYAPYSNYQVGAAVLCRDGSVFTGCNVENAAYPLCICAERVALTSAVAQGQRDFVAIAVATHSTPPASPCGSCRQVMFELGASMDVALCNHAGEVRTTTVVALLPDAFEPAALTPPVAPRRAARHARVRTAP
jgi:cytidine deaminase